MSLEQYWTEFARCLDTAIQQIEAPYFRLPTAGAGEVYAERVYCYELYHQLRLALPERSRFPFDLCGEVNKAQNPIVQQLLGGGYIPDLLVHAPGEMNDDSNLAVIEVKSNRTAHRCREDVKNDFLKLERFQNRDVHYHHGVLLIFGAEPEVLPGYLQEFSRLFASASVLWHNRVGTAPRREFGPTRYWNS